MEKSSSYELFSPVQSLDLVHSDLEVELVTHGNSITGLTDSPVKLESSSKLSRKTNRLSNKTSELNGNTNGLNDKTSEHNERTNGLGDKTSELNRKTNRLSDKTSELNRKTNGLSDKTGGDIGECSGLLHVTSGVVATPPKAIATSSLSCASEIDIKATPTLVTSDSSDVGLKVSTPTNMSKDGPPSAPKARRHGRQDVTTCPCGRGISIPSPAGQHSNSCGSGTSTPTSSRLGGHGISVLSPGNVIRVSSRLVREINSPCSSRTFSSGTATPTFQAALHTIQPAPPTSGSIALVSLPTTIAPSPGPDVECDIDRSATVQYRPRGLIDLGSGKGTGPTVGLDSGKGTGPTQGLGPGKGTGPTQGLGPGKGTGLTQGLDPGKGTGLTQGLDPGKDTGPTQGLDPGKDRLAQGQLLFCDHTGSPAESDEDSVLVMHGGKERQRESRMVLLKERAIGAGEVRVGVVRPVAGTRPPHCVRLLAGSETRQGYRVQRSQVCQDSVRAKASLPSADGCIRDDTGSHHMLPLAHKHPYSHHQRHTRPVQVSSRPAMILKSMTSGGEGTGGPEVSFGPTKVLRSGSSGGEGTGSPEVSLGPAKVLRSVTSGEEGTGCPEVSLGPAKVLESGTSYQDKRGCGECGVSRGMDSTELTATCTAAATAAAIQACHDHVKRHCQAVGKPSAADASDGPAEGGGSSGGIAEDRRVYPLKPEHVQTTNSETDRHESFNGSSKRQNRMEYSGVQPLAHEQELEESREMFTPLKSHDPRGHGSEGGLGGSCGRHDDRNEGRGSNASAITGDILKRLQLLEEMQHCRTVAAMSHGEQETGAIENSRRAIKEQWPQEAARNLDWGQPLPQLGAESEHLTGIYQDVSADDGPSIPQGGVAQIKDLLEEVQRLQQEVEWQSSLEQLKMGGAQWDQLLQYECHKRQGTEVVSQYSRDGLLINNVLVPSSSTSAPPSSTSAPPSSTSAPSSSTSAPSSSTSAPPPSTSAPPPSTSAPPPTGYLAKAKSKGLFTKDSMVTSNAILTENQKSELRPPYENPQPCAMPPDATPPVSSAGACALVVPLAPVYSSSPAPPWLLHESPKPPTRSVNIAVPLKAPLIRPSPLADPLPLARESGAVVGLTQQQSCDVGLQTALSQNSKSEDISSDDSGEECLKSKFKLISAETRDNFIRSSPRELLAGKPALSSGHLGEEDNHRECWSSKEIEEKISRHWEDRATEWIQKELLARMLLSQQQDCGPSFSAGNSPNTCSTCTPEHTPRVEPALHSADSDRCWSRGRAEVKVMVLEELSQVIRSLTGTIRAPPPSSESPSKLSEDGGGDTRSHTASPSSVDTPPISPQTSLPIEDNDEVAESESNLVGGVVLTPTTTPPQPRRSPTVYDVATPEPTETDSSGCMHSLTPSAVLDVATPTESLPPAGSSKSFSSVKSLQPSISDPKSNPVPDSNCKSVSSPCLKRESRCDFKSNLPEPSLHDPILSMSASSNDSTSMSSGQPLSATPSSNTTDQHISLGEAVLHKHAGQGVNSRSEGEVLLSPGDARWYALVETGDTSRMPNFGRTSKPHHSSTLETFLDLKSSSVCSSTEEKSTGGTAHLSNDDGSLGELNRGGMAKGKVLGGRRGQLGFSGGDILVGRSGKRDKVKDMPNSDDTLSNLTSLLDQETDQLRRPISPSMALQPQVTRSCSGLEPGEPSSSVFMKLGHDELHSTLLTTPQSDLSEGEVPVLIKKQRSKCRPGTEANLKSVHSLGHELRNGIDVISVKIKSRVTPGHPSLVVQSEDSDGSRKTLVSELKKKEACVLTFTAPSDQHFHDVNIPTCTPTQTQGASQLAGKSRGKVEAVKSISTAAEVETQLSDQTHLLLDHQLPSYQCKTVDQESTSISIAEDISETRSSTDTFN